VKLGKLLQIATGAVYDRDGAVLSLEPKAKIAECVELIHELGNKAIVFTPYKHSIKMLSEALAKEFTVAEVSGDVSPAKRSGIFHDFQEGDLQVIVAHPQTMAHGLTLTASKGVIWFAPIDNYEIYEQANGRITRPGQAFTPLVVHIVATEVERKVYARLRNKEKMQGLLLTMLEH